MRWTPGGESRDIEDRRGSTGGGLGKGLGLGGTVVVLILSLVFGHNFFNDVGTTGSGALAADSTAAGAANGDVGPVQETPVEHRRVQFVSYVLAHELGHHVQHLLGTDEQVRRLQSANPDMANALSVRLELQADCYAGVWASTTQQRHLLDPGDFESALNAAAAVGDDRIQRAETGAVHPESFTHGTAAQRASWVRRGFTAGQPQACDTFSGMQ